MKDLVSLYLGFDHEFFHKRDRQKASRTYSKLLEENRSDLNALLLNESTLIYSGIYRTLRKLVDLEILHNTMIRKHNEGLDVTVKDLTKDVGVQLTKSQSGYCAGRAD